MVITGSAATTTVPSSWASSMPSSRATKAASVAVRRDPTDMCISHTLLCANRTHKEDAMPDEPTGGGPALFRLVRFWSRRWAGQVAEEAAGEQRRLRDIEVVEAVDGAGAEVSAGGVAREWGIARSGPIRFVADAVEHGYLRRDS